MRFLEDNGVLYEKQGPVMWGCEGCGFRLDLPEGVAPPMWHTLDRPMRTPADKVPDCPNINWIKLGEREKSGSGRRGLRVDVELTISGIPVRGVEIDARTGCAHYRSELDIIAVKFNCCQTYYSCFYCHELEAGHSARIWPRAEFGEKAVLCGACGAELTIREYMNGEAVCPACLARFNPRCALHYHLYFEMPASTD